MSTCAAQVCDRDHSLVTFEALRTIAALYLRADIEGIQQVVAIYHLTDIMAAYVAEQLRSSSSLSGLDLRLQDRSATQKAAARARSPALLCPLPM
jgi:hypothetical protein